MSRNPWCIACVDAAGNAVRNALTPCTKSRWSYSVSTVFRRRGPVGELQLAEPTLHLVGRRQRGQHLRSHIRHLSNPFHPCVGRCTTTVVRASQHRSASRAHHQDRVIGGLRRNRRGPTELGEQPCTACEVHCGNRTNVAKHRPRQAECRGVCDCSPRRSSLGFAPLLPIQTRSPEPWHHSGCVKFACGTPGIRDAARLRELPGTSCRFRRCRAPHCLGCIRRC